MFYADFSRENATFLHSEGVHRVRVPFSNFELLLSRRSRELLAFPRFRAASSVGAGIAYLNATSYLDVPSLRSAGRPMYRK
jgi:hypothetical protein